MTNLNKGFLAGFVATIVLSALMIGKQMMGLMPELNTIKMLTGMVGAPTPIIGWIMHFILGTFIWGGLFTVLDARLPGGHVVNGLIFGTLAWLLMMILVMPMVGAGLFGMALGIMAPVMTLVLHLIYGAVLGGVYGAQLRKSAAAHA